MRYFLLCWPRSEFVSQVDDLLGECVMPNFDCRDISKDQLLNRYDADILGYEAWQELLSTLSEISDANRPSHLFEAFDKFLRQLGIENRIGPCRVFVSHQQKDKDYAERIAYLAHKQGFEYWLDIHDPVLKLTNQTTLLPIVQSILIAAIIEMALLNCTHGISVQTDNAKLSRWIPYEFGRAKQRWLVSTQVASWFKNQAYENSTADYLKLGICTQSEEEVIGWLKDEFDRCSCMHTQEPWRGNSDDVPPKLPN